MSDSDYSDTSYDPGLGKLMPLTQLRCQSLNRDSENFILIQSYLIKLTSGSPLSPASEVSTDDNIDFSDSDSDLPDNDSNRSASPAGSLESFPSPNHSLASTVSNSDMDDQDAEEDATQEYDITQPDGDNEILSENEEEGENMNAAQGLLGDASDEDDVLLVEVPVETIDLCTQSFVEPARPRSRANASGPHQTIDLCTQAAPRPQHFLTQSIIDLSTQRLPAPRDLAAANDVIEIPDSPVTNRQPGTSHNTRYRNANPMNTSPPKQQCRFDPNESATQAVKISCPICLESLIGRNPVSTMCGHLFCTQCIQLSLQNNKLCPMCKKKLTGKSPFHTVFF